MKTICFALLLHFFTPAHAATYQLVEWAKGLSRPVKILLVPGTTDEYFVVEQAGRIRKVKAGVVTPGAVADLTDRVTRIGGGGDERGLLGLAFHPQFSKQRKIYVNYTTQGELRTHVSEFPVRADGTVDTSREKLLLEFAQPFVNHNGGEVAFGPDGYLYIGTGDGGAGGDPHNNGQSLNTLLGKILRIDVNGKAPYEVPKDNPFVGKPGARPEIFAYGLRNPWRFDFHPKTGEIWVGDVGQNEIEEIDIVKKGGNYGWNIMEGSKCYDKTECRSAGLEAPIFEYPRKDGYSVTGGVFYRGKTIPALDGEYIFGDYGSGKIWALGKTKSEVLVASGPDISSFGIDARGEVLVVTLSGKILQLQNRK